MCIEERKERKVLNKNPGLGPLALTRRKDIGGEALTLVSNPLQRHPGHPSLQSKINQSKALFILVISLLCNG